MPLGLRLPRRRKPHVGNVATAAFGVASRTVFTATEESPAVTQSSLVATTALSNLSHDSGTALELAPPRDLWDEAYEALRMTNSKLVEQYEESIMQMSQEDACLAPVGSIARQEQLSIIITKRLASFEEDKAGFTMAGRKIVLQEKLDKIIRIIMFAKDFVSSAVNADPHAALAWAGVCMLLPVSNKNLCSSLFPQDLITKRNLNLYPPFKTALLEGARFMVAFGHAMTSQRECWMRRKSSSWNFPAFLRFALQDVANTFSLASPEPYLAA